MRCPGITSVTPFLVAHVKLFRPQSVHNNLAFQIPNLDAFVRGGAEPVPIGRKDEGMDDFTGIQRVQPLALVQIPQHGGAVFAPRGAETAVGRDADGVEIPGVTHQIVAELAVGQGPHLDESIPSARHNQRHRLRRRESHARHPLGVSVRIGPDGVFAFPQSVPQLDGFIARSRDDLTVVHREGHGQHVLGVAHESAGGAARVDLPQPQRAVPAAAQGELSVRRNDDVGYEVRVAAEGALGVAVGVVLARVGVGEPPADDGFVAGGREDQVRVFGGGGNAGHPVRVAAEGASE